MGVTYVLLGSSMLVRGPRASMAPFAVPEATLSSAHFADFFHFVFVHMVVIGVLIGMLGRLVVDVLVTLAFAYLSVRPLRSDEPSMAG